MKIESLLDLTIEDYLMIISLSVKKKVLLQKN